MFRILIIDDDKQVLASLRDMLEMNGYTVKAFDNPARALQTVENEHFNVVITDCRMPGIDCYDLLNEFDAMEYRPYVIFITAFNAGKYSRENALKHGADRYFEKPLVFDVLIDEIETVQANQSAGGRDTGYVT